MAAVHILHMKQHCCPHLDSSVVLFRFSEHLWPLCTSLAGPGETIGPIYWQAQGRENTINWQKTSWPEQIPVSTQTHTTTQRHGLAPLSVSLPRSGSVLTFSTDPSRVHAGASDACHYPVWRFYLPAVLPPQEGESPLPCELCRVFRGRTCIFKAQPWAHCCPVPFLMISWGCGGIIVARGQCWKNK